MDSVNNGYLGADRYKNSPVNFTGFKNHYPSLRSIGDLNIFKRKKAERHMQSMNPLLNHASSKQISGLIRWRNFYTFWLDIVCVGV